MLIQEALAAVGALREQISELEAQLQPLKEENNRLKIRVRICTDLRNIALIAHQHT